MRYSSRSLARAFVAAVEAAPHSKGDMLVKNFALLLKRSRLLKESKVILDEIERFIVLGRGGRRVSLSTAVPLSQQYRKEITKHLKKEDLVREKVDPRCVAGLKVVIDDEVVIDGTLGRKLAKLFNNPIRTYE